jgi:uncharacterized protein (TIGR03382 family)
VQLDFLSSSLGSGVPGIGQDQLVHLFFEVTSTAAGSANMDFLFDDQLGSVFALGDGSQPTLGLGSRVVVNLPEPTAGLLSLAALTTVVALRRRRHT